MASSNYTGSSFSTEELSVTLFEEAGDALFLFDPETEQLVDINPMAQRLSGFSRTELLRMPITYFLRSEIQGGLRRLRQAYQKTGIFHSQEGFLLRHQRGGVWIPVNLTVTRLHAEPKTLGLVTARDVREQREMYTQLKKADADLRSVLCAVSDCIWSADILPDGKLKYRMVSPVVERITGRPPEFYLPGPERWLSTVHPEDRSRLHASCQRIMTGRSTREEEEYRVIRPDGTMRWVRDSVRVSRNAGGSSRVDGVVTDITERKYAEQAVLRSEELFRSLVENAADAVCLINAEGTILYSSPSVTRILGYTLEEFVGQNVLSFLQAGDLQHGRELFGQLSSEAGKELTGEVRLRHKDSSYRTIEATSSNRLEDPSVGALVVNYRDVSERKRAEEEIRLLQTIILAVSETGDLHSALCVALQKICEATGWVLAQAWIPRADLGVLECSSAWYCSAGGFEEFRALSLTQLFPPGVGVAGAAWAAKRAVWMSDIAESSTFPRGHVAKEAGLVAGLGVPLLADSEVVAVVEFYVCEGREEDENLVRLVSALAAQVGTTIRRKLAEEALRESEERYRTLVENSYDLICEVDALSRFVYLSPNYQDVLGYEPDYLLGRNFFDLVYPSELPSLLGQINSPSKPVAYRYRNAAGEWRWFESIGKTYEQANSAARTFIFSRDITSRKRAEEELAHERDLLHILMENVPHLIYFKDSESRFTRINRAQVLNLKVQDARDAIGKTDFDFYPEALAREFFADEQRIVQTGAPLLDKIERQTGDDATERWISSTKVPIVAADGKITGIVGVSRDITERRRAEEAIRASEAKYRSLIENLEQGIFLKDREMRFVAANRFFCQYTNAAEADILGKTDHNFFPRHLADKYQADDRLVLNEGRRLELEEENILHGKARTVRVIKTPVKDAQGRIVGVLGIFWDVTEQRALEAQLRQSQKMEAVGQLAGGVAHDFNNLLTVILGNVSLLQTSLGKEDARGDLLAATEKAALRAAELTTKMLGFSRRTTLRLEPVSLNHCADEGVVLLRRTIDPRIVVEVKRVPDLWLVHADLGQINQVLMNLCLNARDAMPEGGVLTLEAENVTLPEDAVCLHLEARAGEFVRLRVTDTGEGIAPDILPRIFEPFFTTKAPGKGTGLGLAMVFGIVKQHQGWIDCCSEVGRGTRFDIYLPRYIAGDDPRPVGLITQSPRRGTETILLADDEPMIRNLGRTILQGYGYRVQLAEDGRKAVELYTRAQGRIDLVILDLTMPQLSGRDAYRQLQEIDPNVRVLFASGYSSEHVTAAEGERILGFVGKPYRPEELANKVRAALDKAAAGEQAHASESL